MFLYGLVLTCDNNLSLPESLCNKSWYHAYQAVLKREQSLNFTYDFVQHVRTDITLAAPLAPWCEWDRGPDDNAAYYPVDYRTHFPRGKKFRTLQPKEGG